MDIKQKVWEWLEAASTVCEGMGCPPIINRIEFDEGFVEGEEIPFQVGESAVITFVPSEGEIYLSVNDRAPSTHAVAVLCVVFERAPATEHFWIKQLGLPFVVNDNTIRFIGN